MERMRSESIMFSKCSCITDEGKDHFKKRNKENRIGVTVVNIR